MNILTPRERDVLTKRYGLDNNDEITQKEIAKKFGYIEKLCFKK